MSAEFNQFTASYCAGYVVKKMTAVDDPRLAGRHPEFARMSNRPGLGSAAMDNIARQLSGGPGLAEFLSTGRVPLNLKIGRKDIPIGRYLRKQLTKRMEVISDAHFAQHVIDYARFSSAISDSLELRAVLISKGAYQGGSTLTVKGHLLDEWQGKMAQVEGRAKLQRRKKL